MLFGWRSGCCVPRRFSWRKRRPASSILRGYVGANDTVHDAVAEWSYAYAEKSLDDFHQLRAAAAAGEIEVAGDPGR